MSAASAPTWSRQLYLRWQVLVHEVAKFGVVGIFCAVLDIGIFNVLLHHGVGPLTSKGTSTIIAATTSYFLNRHWSFSHRARTGLRREYVLFIILSAIGLGIAEACLALSHYGLGFTGKLADNIAANGFGMVFGTAFRFWSFKRWVFLPADPQDEPVEELALQ